MKKDHNIFKEKSNSQEELFSVPDDYFNELETKLNSIAQQKRSNKTYLFPILLAAASLILCFGIFFNNKDSSAAYIASLKSVSNEELAAILLENGDESYFTDVEFNTNAIDDFYLSDSTEQYSKPQVTEEDFDDYFESEFEYI